MDDLGEGLGDRIGGLGGCALPALVLVTLLAVLFASPVLAAQEKAKEKAKDAGPPALIEYVKGDKIKMAKAKVADRVVRILDGVGDQATLDGSPAPEAPRYSDIASVYIAPVKVPGKLIDKMTDGYPRGTADAFYGQEADWSRDDRAVFVAVRLAKKRPSDLLGQQVEIGLDGDAAAAVRAGGAHDVRSGVERFSISGLFTNGASVAGTTDISGLEPGGELEYYNTTSGVFGYYDRKTGTYFVIMPREGDAQSVAVTLRTNTDEGEIIDRLELPGGGHLVDLSDPTAGFDRKAGGPPLACRSLETFSADSGTVTLADPDHTVIRYSVGADPAASGASLAALDEYGSTIPMTFSAVGTEADPFTIDATLTRAPALGAATLTVEVPAGQWTFGPADGYELLTPAGERIVDAASLTGRAGLRTGPGLDGFVGGDPLCARWDLGMEACDLVPAADLADVFGISQESIVPTSVERPDGTQWCAGTVADTGEPRYIAGFGTGYYDAERFAADTAARACDAYPFAAGAEGANFDCSADGYENFYLRVVPDVIAESHPDGGLLVSVDVVVDAGRAHGDRYDAAAAQALFDGVARAVASSAAPASAVSAGAVLEEPAATD